MAVGLGNASASVLRAAAEPVLCCGVWPGGKTTDGFQCRMIGSANMCQEAWSAAATTGVLVSPNGTKELASGVGVIDLGFDAVAPQWSETVWPWVALPMITEIALLFICPLFRRIYRKVFNRCEGFQRFVIKYIGCEDSPHPLCPNVLIWLGIWQLNACLLSVATFAYRTLTLQDNVWVLGIEMVLGWGFVIHYFIMLMKTGFVRQDVSQPIAHFVELLTVPQFVCGATASWLSLGYLRTYRALITYDRLEAMNSMGIITFFAWASPVQRLIFQSFLRFASIIICFAGTILVLEVLGEPDWISQRYLKTQMGEINFFVMAYWVLETISTVGYGDFAPQTTMSRFCTAACFLSGVIFFALETNTIADIWRMQTFGTGAYADRGRKHILICGGAAEAADANSLKVFFAELFHPSFKQTSPDAVVLVNTDDAVLAFRNFVNTEVEGESQRRIEIMRGSALQAEDLQRCRCGDAELAVVLANTTALAHSEEEEDQENILRALSIQQIYPSTPLRLSLLCPESQDLAISARIWPQRCLGLSRMKASLLWQSCRCLGWSSLIGNLLVTTDALERTHILSANQTSSTVETWRAGYVDGMAQEVYGFLPALEYVGKPFLELVKAAYSIENAIIIGCQVGGEVRLAPFHALQEVTEDTIIFSLDATLNLDDVSNSVLRAGNWQKVFYANRRQNRAKVSSGTKIQANEGVSTPALPKPPRVDFAVMEKRAAAIRNGGSSRPFILFIEFAESWRTLSTFLSARAESWHATRKPLIVLAPTEPPENLWDQLLATSDTSIGLVLGSGKCMQVLARAGVHVASCIVCPAMQKLVVNQSSNPERGTALDANAVMLYNILGRLQLLGKVKVTMEMHRIENVRLLPASAAGSAARRTGTTWGESVDFNEDEEDAEDRLQEERLEKQIQLRIDRIVAMSYREMQQAMLVGGQAGASQDTLIQSVQSTRTSLLADSRSVQHRSRCRQCWHSCLRRCGYLDFKRALHKEAPFRSSFGTQMCGSSKYISGEVFTTSIFAALLARTNYVPGILEVMQALIAPEETSDVFPWQILVRPAWIGKPFSNVFHDLLADQHGPALGLGLYRMLTSIELASEPNAPTGFVWTNPAPSTLVKGNDRVYVLASSAWGKCNR